MSKKRKINVTEASNLRWLAFSFPFTENPKDETDKISNLIHIYCMEGANKIEELTRTINNMNRNKK